MLANYTGGVTHRRIHYNGCDLTVKQQVLADQLPDYGTPLAFDGIDKHNISFVHVHDLFMHIPIRRFPGIHPFHLADLEMSAVDRVDTGQSSRFPQAVGDFRGAHPVLLDVIDDLVPHKPSSYSK